MTQIVAHDLRLGAVQGADQIVVMDRGPATLWRPGGGFFSFPDGPTDLFTHRKHLGGQILERGQHEELLQLNGSYKRWELSEVRAFFFFFQEINKDVHGTKQRTECLCVCVFFFLFSGLLYMAMCQNPIPPVTLKSLLKRW